MDSHNTAVKTSWFSIAANTGMALIKMHCAQFAGNRLTMMVDGINYADGTFDELLDKLKVT